MTIFNNKNKFIAYVIAGIIIVFCGSFTAVTIKNKLDTIKENENSKSIVVNTNKDSNPLKNVQVILNITYLKSGETIPKTVVKGEQFKNATVKDVISFYENDDYSLLSNENNKIVLIKKIDLYSPNKYFLGIKDDKLAIFKTDDDGNPFIENEKTDITNIDIKNLSPGDIEIIKRGDKQFQFDTREGAASKLEDYI